MDGSESATIAYHLLRNARRHGIDVSDLEERYGIWLDQPISVLRRLPLAHSFELWEALLARVADPSLPHALAIAPFPEAVAVFVFVTTSRRTLREALELLVTSSALITTAVRFDLQIDEPVATLRVIGPEIDRPGSRAAVEFLVGHVVHDIRCATNLRCQPVVDFAHAERATTVTFSAADLDLPLDVIDGLTAIVGCRVDPSDLRSRVRDAIARSLAKFGNAPISAIAATLGLATRTLQRRLPSSGETFQDLVRAAQRDLALALVQMRPELSIKEIAIRVGYASPRAFARAYRRWTGTPPARARLRA